MILHNHLPLINQYRSATVSSSTVPVLARSSLRIRSCTRPTPRDSRLRICESGISKYRLAVRNREIYSSLSVECGLIYCSMGVACYCQSHFKCEIYSRSVTQICQVQRNMTFLKYIRIIKQQSDNEYAVRWRQQSIFLHMLPYPTYLVKTFSISFEIYSLPHIRYYSNPGAYCSNKRITAPHSIPHPSVPRKHLLHGVGDLSYRAAGARCSHRSLQQVAAAGRVL